MLPESQGLAQQRRGPSQPPPAERRLALLWAAVVLVALALRPLWLLAPQVLPRCRFRALTGLPCPTCGTAHAAAAMLHGHLGQAFAANPLTSACGLLFLVGGAVAPVWVLVARRRLPRLPGVVPRWALVAAAAAVALNWLYLIASR